VRRRPLIPQIHEQHSTCRVRQLSGAFHLCALGCTADADASAAAAADAAAVAAAVAVAAAPLLQNLLFSHLRRRVVGRFGVLRATVLAVEEASKSAASPSAHR
jgi:hypothetical protein